MLVREYPRSGLVDSRIMMEAAAGVTTQTERGHTLHGSYRYRLYPTVRQQHLLGEFLDMCRQFYNEALQERREAYEQSGRIVRGSEQCRGKQSLKTRLRAEGGNYWMLPHSVMDSVVRRLDYSYKEFYRRMNKGERSGQPRFKGAGWYKSVAYPDSRDFELTHDGKSRHGGLWLGRGERRELMGRLKVRIHREIPAEAKIRRVTLKREGSGRWYMIANWEIEDYEPPPHPNPGSEVGVHLGLSAYVSTDRGEVKDSAPDTSDDRNLLRKRQRRMSRKTKGSNRRERARRLCAKQHERIRNRRRDFQHKLSTELARSYETIYVGRYQVKRMLQGDSPRPLRTDLVDASWSEFLKLVQHKAEKAGVGYEEVEAYDVAQICSGCGHQALKRLDARQHRCPNCGLSLPRGVNAARNISQRGRAARAQSESSYGKGLARRGDRVRGAPPGAEDLKPAFGTQELTGDAWSPRGESRYDGSQ